MSGIQLIGHGDFDQLIYRTDIPTPRPVGNEVLIRVAAAGINNTDINTRIGWYATSAHGSTSEVAENRIDSVEDSDSWWDANLKFPRIQGADCCGFIMAVGDQVDAGRVGERVLVRAIQSAADSASPILFVTFGADVDGGFAQYTKVDSCHALVINSDWSDIELASLPCAYSTAEAMLCRANVEAERVLVTGASGGVGSAAVQLAKRRGAEVVAVAAKAKADDVRALGADRVVYRGLSLTDELGTDAIDVAIDLVGGPLWPEIPEVLKAGGRYVTSGAIAGPIVKLDLRALYLKDLAFFGSTHQSREIFTNLIGYVERNEIKPVVARSYALEDIVQAQQDFLSKKYTGKLVLVPPPD